MIKQLFFRFFSACAVVLLVVSCQDPAPVSERATIPFSLTVHTEGTKVSYDNGSYQFKAGDRLHVVGIDRTDVEGYLTQNGTVWSGELSYEVATGLPAGDTRLAVTLIHADNPDAGTYASAIVGTVPEGSTALREAVEHYSLFTTDVTLATTSATLHQQATFLEVKVVFDFDGTHTVEPGQALVDLVTTRGEATVEVDFVDPSDQEHYPVGEDYEVSFMAVIPGGQAVNMFTLTVGDRRIEFSDNSLTLASNKKYTVNRVVEYRPQLGDPFWSDGTYGRLRHADPNASIVGIIVYVNHHYDATLFPDKAAIDDAITEKAAGYGHGLVMALHNVAVGVPWSIEEEPQQCTSGFVNTPKKTISASNLSGLANTNSIVTKLGEGAVSAASRAQAYKVDNKAAPSNTTGWFLPSVGQWMYTISTDGFGGANPTSQWLNGDLKNWLNEGGIGNLILVKERNDDLVNDLIKDLNDRLSQLASDFSSYSLTYDGFGDPSAEGNKSDNYWTSSEYDKDKAIRMNLGTVEHKGDKYYSSIKVASIEKNKTSYSFEGTRYMKVRPFLAF